ncbi:MAG: hypothetical protein JST65_07100 [Acidobacteria bacterium]|nr:hypothetical protein [Acidobacteriota bacterium]
MRATLLMVALVATAGLSQAQGVTAPWDLRKTLESLQAGGARLKPVLEQLDPKEWEAKGAPDGYDLQKKQVLLQLQNVTAVAQRLAADPEKLTVALDLFLRIETFDLNLQSLAEGVRNYHNPAAAELLVGMRNENGHARAALRTYMVELAQIKEQEFKIVDDEAQKCRAQTLRKKK